ncbi:hypothetical protein [Bradyrhizobium sp. ARR65]|uniref:hypothetical protein n=1 Tax=Bradyrhizobium sp. ARR65 TaxID=1040989 RepID=UPI0012F9772B|nr:hypothetical protein [Bradyrhizobium sp. ARR65]
MPSDFNPMFLILGDGADLAALSATLRRFAVQPKKISLTEQAGTFQPRTPLTIVPADREFGLRASGQDFAWHLNQWQAQNIAERVDVLASPEARSGSDIFEIGSEGEIPVKVSRGEYTDDFLISKR